MKVPFKIPVLLALLCFGCLFSQKDNDFATWTSIEVEYEPDKKWELGLETQLRLDENSSAIDEYFSQLKVSREIGKDFEVGIGLRYIRENDNRGQIQGYENHFRFQIDTKYEHEIGGFDMEYRLRYTNKNEFGLAEEADEDFARQRLRFKAETEYKIKDWKLDPKFSAELFSRFGRDTETEIDQYRLTLGTEYNLKKFGEIRIFYRFENDIENVGTEAFHILGLGYKYTID